MSDDSGLDSGPKTDVPNLVPPAAVSTRKAPVDKRRVAKLSIDYMMNRASQIARVVKVTARRVYSIQRELVALGVLVKEPGSWPASFRPGPNFDSYTSEVRPHPKPSSGFSGRARFHRLTLCCATTGTSTLEGVDGLRHWTSGRGRLTFYGFRVPVQGRSISMEVRERVCLIYLHSFTADGGNEYLAAPDRIHDDATAAMKVASKALGVVLMPKSISMEIAIEDYGRTFQLSYRHRFKSADGKAWTDFSKGFAEWETSDLALGWDAFRLPLLIRDYDRVTFVRSGSFGTHATTVYTTTRLEPPSKDTLTGTSEDESKDEA